MKPWSIFSIDKRSLGLGRILIGLVVIGDVLNRSLSLTEHYTDDGILPRKLMFENFFYPTWFTIHAASGEYYSNVYKGF